MKTAIIIPAFNEEKTITKVINSVKKFGTPIVICDGSNDATYLKANKSGVYVIKHKKNLGYDQSIKTGINFVLKKKFDYALTFDADNEVNANLLKLFQKKISTRKYSLILGTRDIIPRFSEKFFCLYTKIFYKVPDILSGVKAYSIDLCRKNKKIFKEKTINTGLAMEVLRKKEKYCMIPIKIKFRRHDSRLGNVTINLRIFKTMFKEIIKDMKVLLKKNI